MESRREICPSGYSFSGAQLRAARKANKLSCWDVSVALTRQNDFISPATLRTWEIGIAEPRVTTFFTLARILRRPPHSFFQPNTQQQPEAPARGKNASKRAR